MKLSTSTSTVAPQENNTQGNTGRSIRKRSLYRAFLSTGLVKSLTLMNAKQSESFVKDEQT